jgi:serine/threonine protein kinase
MSMSNDQTGRLSPQSLLQQRYLILGQIGRGGMGAVYKAEDTRFSRRYVAIKEMSQSHLNTVELEMAIARFQQEADMLASLVHPNLPRITDRFSDQERSYLVMDFIDGKTLLQLLKETPNHQLPVAQVLYYARQLCDVLIYLHGHQPPIIFRDLKPTNVMITPRDQVFLIDFGIARSFKEGKSQDTFFLGSPGYAPPEQHGYAQTNPRSDLYGLGATLHYCLTGRDPFYAQDRFSFPPVQQLNPQVPPELDRLIQHLVAQNEWERPTSAREVQQALMRISQEATAHTSAALPPMLPAPPAPAINPASAPTQYASPVIGGNDKSAGNSPRNPTIPVMPSASSSIPPLQQQVATIPAFPSVTKVAPSITSIWTRPFILMFSAFLVLTLGGGLFVLSVLYPTGYGYAFLFESFLSLLLLLIAGAGTGIIRVLIPRSILTITIIAALFSGLVFLGLGLSGLPPTFTTLVQSVNPNIGLIIVSIISLLWLVRPFRMLDRVILAVPFGIALICTLIQSPTLGIGASQNQSHLLLLVAFIALIQGTLLAVQMERVRGKAKV